MLHVKFSYKKAAEKQQQQQISLLDEEFTQNEAVFLNWSGSLSLRDCSTGRSYG